MRFHLVAAIFLALFGCDEADRQGMVLMLDESYRAEVLATEADGIASPDGLLWWNRTLFIADEGGSAVRVWKAGRGVRTLADRRNGLASPEDLARGADGTLYASDDTAGGIWRIDGRGRTTSLSLGSERLGATEGLALSPDGTLLVGDAESRSVVRVVDGGGTATIVRQGHQVLKPESFAFDGNGRLFIADNEANIVYSVGADSRLLHLISDREGFSPESLHFGHGALFITDSEHGKLFRYTEQTGLTPLAAFGGGLANVQGITSDERGNLYVSVQSDLKGRRGFIIRLSPDSVQRKRKVS